jgi:hypothetical protein
VTAGWTTTTGTGFNDANHPIVMAGLALPAPAMTTFLAFQSRAVDGPAKAGHHGPFRA